MTEFSGAPFVGGSLFGLRAFGVDKLGRLHGPSYRQVFRPDENEAECRKEQGSFSSGMLSPYITTGNAYLTFAPDDYLRRALGMLNGGTAKVSVSPTTEAEVKVDPPEHRIGQLDCSCGFYAYFDGGNDYQADDRVSAIIEGYGICTVGDRGFRASKARLTALIIPTKRREKFALVLRNYPDVPVYSTTKAALAEHPISADQIPTPDDPTFWTRPVR